MSTAPSNLLSLTELLGLFSNAIKTSINQALAKARVALPCIVQSFDPATQTVSVLPAVAEKVYKTINGVNTPTDFNWGDPTPLPWGKVPIVFPKAGPFVLTMPPQPGDECLVVFADYCTDSWVQSGGTGNVQLELRRHNLSDGFAIMGVWSQPNLINDFNPSAAELRTLDGTVKISLSETGIVITGNVTFLNNVTVSGVTALQSVEANGLAQFINGVIAAGTLQFNSITWSTHTHPGVSTGVGNTGPPV
jgi:protein gp138